MSQRFEIISQQVNTENGLVTSSRSITKTIIKQGEPEPSFVKCYLHDISILHKVQRFTETILWELMKYMDYNNEIPIPGERKKELCRKMELYKTDPIKGLVPNTNLIDQNISKLLKRGILIKKGVGVFIANPMIFGKGKWEDIKNIRLQINYSIAGKELSSDIEK